MTGVILTINLKVFLDPPTKNLTSLLRYKAFLEKYRMLI